MSKRSDSPVSDRFSSSSLDLSEGSSASDMDSDNSRDVNLNSKKFTDCNLVGSEIGNKNNNNSNNNNNNKNNNNDHDSNYTSAIEDLNTKYNLRSGESERTEVQSKKPGLNLENELEISNDTPEIKKALAISTPKPEWAESYNLLTISTDDSLAETGSEGGQTYLVAKTALNQSASITNEEIRKTFEDLSFAFKTDSMTIQKRLQLLKRRRDLAESNIEKELGIIRGKLKTLQYLGLNSECINLMTDLKKQLDFVLNATIHLSSSAEGYGYAQHEERLLEFIAAMLQHVEDIETAKRNSSKTSDKLKGESQRSPTSVLLDGSGDEDRLLRRRSVAAVTMQGNCRRRASIATLPRIANSVENGSNGRGSQWTSPNRPVGAAAKKLLFSQPSPRSHFSGLPGSDDSRRDSISTRHRKESRTNEVSMTDIDESPEQRSSVESELIKEPIETNSNTEVNDSSLHLKQLFESLEEVRRSSSSQEHITAGHWLRRIVEWNKLLLSSARFRWPENVLHYAPFYITWYIVFVLALVFIGGLFTGINGCYTYSCLKHSALCLATHAFFSFTRRFYRFLLPLFLTLLFALGLFFFWLTGILLPRLTSEEIDSLYTTFGLEIRYLNGPPPV